MTRRILVVCALVATLACAPAVHAQQQSQAQKPSTSKPAAKTTKPKPKSETAKPAAKPETPTAASAPNLLAQFGEGFIEIKQVLGALRFQIPTNCVGGFARRLLLRGPRSGRLGCRA